MKRNPEFIIFTGPMASGKTSGMLSSLERFKYQSRLVFAFKPSLDNRYAQGEIVTHNGLRWAATTVTSTEQIMEALAAEDASQPDVVAVDEAFMLPGIADALIWLYKQGVTIVVSTLDFSAKGVPFKETTKMLVWATKVHKCTAVCTVCGADAYFTHRKIVDPIDDVWVGGLDVYDPRCIGCHPTIRDND